jgi:ABC-type nitrate/sulfonate/bicarbonate transport system substrate-binding protein
MWAVLAAALPLAGHAAPPTPNTLARLTFTSGWDALPAVVGIERGFFAQEGLVVSGLSITKGEAIMQSLASGTTDFAAVPQRTFLVMAAAKLPVKAVAMNGWGTRAALSSAKSLSDLKGKTIAVNTGSEVYPALIRLLNQSKMKPSDVKIVQLSADDMVLAIRNKKADAVFASAHFTEPLVAHGDARLLLSDADIVKATGFVGAQALVASDKTLQRDPAMVQKFVNGWVKANLYIEQDPDDAARLLQIFFHRQGVASTLEQTKAWVGMTHHNRSVWSKDDIADANYNGWGLVEGGILKVQPKVEGYVDSSFAKKAETALGSPPAARND